MGELNRDQIDIASQKADDCWRFEPDGDKLAKLPSRLYVKKTCGLCLHWQECYGR